MQQKSAITEPAPHIRAVPTDDYSYKARPKSWRPVTLRVPYLTALLFVTAGLIVTIQWLLSISRRDQGIMFAQDINKVSLRRSFACFYLPTIISVTYSFLWTWVDLDIKRLEPYFQLSKPGGATGANSILLNYPLEFLVTLPFVAFKHGHWIIVTASTIMILVFWGLTPTNSGLFATQTLRVSREISGTRSTAYIPLPDQGNLSAIYAQSVYNIAWLNESLPPFMTRDFVLSAFGPSETIPAEAMNTNYTGQTTLYSVDIACDPAPLVDDPDAGVVRYNGSQSCLFYAPPYRPYGGNDTAKPFDTMYVGYQNQNGLADYYLSDMCNESNLHHFFVRWSKSYPEFILNGHQAAAVKQGQANATSLFCKPTYYQQRVSATISLASNAVLEVQRVGSKVDLPDNLFNTSTFEWAMSSGEAQFPVRAGFPTNGFPDQKSNLEKLPLNLAYVPKMAPFAIATNRRPLDAYLDSETLRLSYQSAYRLLFARQLVDVLSSTLDTSSTMAGQITYNTQAVVIVPGFAYAATALLSLVSLLALKLLLALPKRRSLLDQDPATIGTLMELVAHNPSTVQSFLGLDRASQKCLERALSKTQYSLSTSAHYEGLSVVSIQRSTHDRFSKDTEDITNAPGSCSNGTLTNEYGGIRPTEMKLLIGAIFLAVQISAAVVFLVLFIYAKRHHGLRLPPTSLFIRQIFESYIPIALATFLEPFWLVLNRLLCLLQPLEELRKGNARASRSVDVDYSSLPPQLLFWRAFRAHHFVMVLVCFMALLGNVLAVSLSGLMYEGQVLITKSSDFSLSREAKFRPLNGNGLPFNTQQKQDFQGGSTSDPFYRLMSNVTAHTLLPPWTDSQYGYLPSNISSQGTATSFQLQTQAFGANLQCQTLSTSEDRQYSLNFSSTALSASLLVNILNDTGQVIQCTDFPKLSGNAFPVLIMPDTGHVALELGTMLASNTSAEHDLFCRQHILMAWLREEWQLAEGSVFSNSSSRAPSGEQKMEVVSRNETVLLCKPNLVFGTAEIIVDSTGHVRNRNFVKSTSEALGSYFSTSAADLVAQANQFLTDNGGTWHKDAYPSDFINYLSQISANDSSLLNASLPVPDPDLAARYMSSTYRSLFAILIGTNIDILFKDTDSANLGAGFILQPETRILFSTPAFIISESILVCYIIVTVFFYARRPWRILPRLPSTPASIIAFLAASWAVKELGEEQSFRRTSKETRASWSWSYGTFQGTDNQSHVGIEREPFVCLPPKHLLRRRR